MAAKYGVDNPVPPWKTSLDGMCDALDQSACGPEILDFVDRRNEEDELSATVYSELPYPENRLVALAHSLVLRGRHRRGRAGAAAGGGSSQAGILSKILR